MKKTIYLFVIAFLICLQTKAQNMPVPDPNTPNVLFLKYSVILNGNNSSFFDDQIRISETEAIRRPTYTYLHKLVGEMGVWQKFYVPNPEEFAYIDPTSYNAVSLSKMQLYNILNPKHDAQRKAYLESFTEIYLIDYEQKQPKQPTKVKITKVRPCNFWF
jgi:hypothetical protein